MNQCGWYRISKTAKDLFALRFVGTDNVPCVNGMPVQSFACRQDAQKWLVENQYKIDR